MNEWLLAASVLLVGGLVPLGDRRGHRRRDLRRGRAESRRSGRRADPAVAAEGLHRQPFVDLAVVLAIVSFVGSVIVARFLEWGV